MKVEHIRTLDHRPGFEGHLYKLPSGIKPNILEYLTRDVPRITTGRAKATKDGIAVVDLFADHIKQLLRSFGIKATPFTVPDEEILVGSVDNLLTKYNAA